MSADAPGPYYVVEVTVDNPERDVAALQRAGLNVINRDGALVTVYVNDAGLAILAGSGYPYEIVEQQPKPRPKSTVVPALGEYHDYAALSQRLSDYAAAYGATKTGNPDICRLYTLGQSVQGRELWAMLITDNPDIEEAEPEFKYIATMHGDEVVGTEMCLYFIDELLTGYGTDNRVTDLVNSTAIWIVPLMNPDGLELGQRGNALGLDLNRNFPSWPADFSGTVFDGAPVDTVGRQVETSHVMNWVADNSFVLSGNFHGGALVVNYPYDDDDKGTTNDSPTPDDPLIEALSLAYASNHVAVGGLPSMATNSNPVTPAGIVNGAVWYEIDGGMQDWHYRYAGCIDVTLEIGTAKTPDETLIPDYWTQNRESMYAYLEGVHRGVRGVVTDSVSGDPVYAKVTVAGNAQPVFTDPDVGDYYRLLLANTYTLTFEAPGYRSKTEADVIVGAGAPIELNVELESLSLAADVDNSGQVNAADLQWVILATLGETIPHNADVDGNGSVNAVDIQLVVNTLLGK